MLLALALAAGLWLRLHLIASQIVSDDEWHGLHYVIGKSPGWLLTHFSIPGATCIPLNFYAWAIGESVGWSEISLRVPSLVCGILGVIAGPLLARKIIGPERAGLLALLLAVSPLLIFYSRICRPYSAVALLSFVSLLAAVHWMRSGGRRATLLYIVSGALAVYFHLYAAVAVAAPVLTALGLHAWSRWWKRRPVPGPPLKHWLLAAAVMAGFLTVAVLPALVASLRSTFFQIALKGWFDPKSLPRVAMLLSGTGEPVLALLFWAAFVLGAHEQIRRDRWFGVTFLGLYPLHAVALLISRPDSAQSAIVLTRYCLPLAPVSLLFVACGVQRAVEALGTRVALHPALRPWVGIGFAGALALGGPLPQCYVTPNNFTSHGIYQHRYGPIDWRLSFYSDITPRGFKVRTTIRIDEISPFYARLAEESGSAPVVEYPMMIGDHFNPLYYYQHFHQRPVLAGYTTNTVMDVGLASGNVFGSTYIDQVLTRVGKTPRLRFHQLMLMDDLATLRGRGVEYVILHKFYEAQLPVVADRPPELDRLLREYQAALGPPAYEDVHLTVFRL